MKTAGLVCGIFLIFLSQSLDGQALSDSTSTRVALHYGPKGVMFKTNGGLISTSQGGLISYETGSTLVSVRYARTNELQFLTPSYPKETAEEITVLVGQTHRSGSIFSSISAGISYVSGVKKGELVYSESLSRAIGLFWDFPRIPGVIDYYQEIGFKTVGLAFHAQYFWLPIPSVGVGLDGVADINKEATYVGVLLSVRWTFSS